MMIDRRSLISHDVYIYIFILYSFLKQVTRFEKVFLFVLVFFLRALLLHTVYLLRTCALPSNEVFLPNYFEMPSKNDICMTISCIGFIRCIKCCKR